MSDQNNSRSKLVPTPQIEPIDEAVLAHSPGLRDTGGDVALRVQHHEALEQIARDVDLDIRHDLVWIERFRLG